MAKLSTLQKLAESDVTDIESHGQTHTDFVDLSLGAAKSEMKKSKQFLEENDLNTNPNMLAYPHAKSTAEIRQAASEFYSFAFGSRGIVTPDADIDYMNLPRVTVSQKMSFLKYKITLSRLYWWLKGVYSKIG